MSSQPAFILGCSGTGRRVVPSGSLSGWGKRTARVAQSGYSHFARLSTTYSTAQMPRVTPMSVG